MSAPGPDPAAPLGEPVGPDPVAAAGAPRHRTHPITPLVSGWKIVVGIIAVLTAQNIARLVDDFTLQRALIGLGVVAAAVVVAILFSSLSWWFTTYAVDDQGVSLHRGVVSKSREYAPRARIESVSVERPLLARLLGLAKVRVEVAGGGESYLDIEYVRSSEAEQLRRRVLGVAALAEAGDSAERPAQDPAAAGSASIAEATGAATEPDGAEHAPALGEAPASAERAETPAPAERAEAPGALENVLYDGVTDGELIAKIPTERLVRSLVRDLGFLIGILMSIVGVGLAIALGIWTEGINIAMLIALAPALIAVPKFIFGRIESGWGFVSRITDRGLRMRRGLANTRTDNIAFGRIQRFVLRRPWLWRTPDWTSVTVTVAGIDDDFENGAQNALPVGTREELAATLGHLAAPLGTEDDLATLEHLLTAPARSLEGLRKPFRAYWIARRTQVTVLLPGALIHRSGVLGRTVEIIPRERIQQVTLSDDPLGRRLGVLDLAVGIAGHTLHLTGLARRDALALHEVLSRDARTLRRYRDRERWPAPALAAAGRPAGR
ncbi:PH domain-containing protein [Brachybacterium sp. AOP43-C2-M15]|uniref:PH domain-containing protein n=1 Tax=Brachybacterium sp. AOP43-C2-M15 TaxID=3457661 RepID=UPI004034F0DD